MTRVLHVIGRDADLQTQASVDALCEGGMAGVVAESSPRRGAWANFLWGLVHLRREAEQFDVVHAWDGRALTAAMLSGARRIVFTLPARMTASDRRALDFAGRRRQLQIVATTPAQRRFADVVIRPPLPREPLPDGSSRADMRERLGIAGDEFVLLAPGESTRASSHDRAVWAASLLHVTDERYRVLLWGRGPKLFTADDLGRRLRQHRLVIVAPRALGEAVEYEQLLPAVDAALVAATGPVPTLPVALAMAAGVPVVAASRPEFSGMLAHGQTAFTVPRPTPRTLAQGVLDVRADPDVTQSIVTRAKERAAELFRRDTFLEQHRRLYAGMASQIRRKI